MQPVTSAFPHYGLMARFGPERVFHVIESARTVRNRSASLRAWAQYERERFHRLVYPPA
jgi:hypothetical protein